MSGKKALPAEIKGDCRGIVRRKQYMQKFALPYKHPERWLPIELMDRLDRCADDEARRILLGISK